MMQDRQEKIKKGLVLALDFLAENGQISKADFTILTNEIDSTGYWAKRNIIYVLVQMGIIESYNKTLEKWSVGEFLAGKSIKGVINFEKFIKAASCLCRCHNYNGGDVSEFISDYTGDNLYSIFSFDEKSKVFKNTEVTKSIESSLLDKLLNLNEVEKYNSFTGEEFSAETRINLFAEKFDLTWEDNGH
jgi:hypothetical protein